MDALDAFDSFLFSLSRAFCSPLGVFVQIQVCFFFFFFLTLLRFALAVSFFRSKIRLVAEKVEELIVFILHCLLFLNLVYVIEPFGYIWFDWVEVASFGIFFFLYVGFRFVNNWNPIFKIHFIIFLNFLGNQTVDHLVLSYSSIFLSLSCNFFLKKFLFIK